MNVVVVKKQTMELVTFAVKMKVIVILTMIVMVNFCVEKITVKAMNVQVLILIMD